MFETGTITSATPWAALSAVIQGKCGGAGLANWSFVERIPAGTGLGTSGAATYHVDVFKCAASGTDASDAEVDWYFALRIPTPDGAVTSLCNVFEDYEGGSNKRFRRPAPAPVSAVPTGAEGWRSDTYAQFAQVTGLNIGGTLQALNVSGFTYWLKMSRNFIGLALRVGTTYTFNGALVFDSLVTSFSDPAPIAVMGGQSTAGAAFTRIPGITTAATNNWGIAGLAWIYPVSANLSNPANQDKWADGKVSSSRIVLRHVAGATAATAATQGGVRGFVKPEDMIMIATDASVYAGDTMAIGADTWVVMYVGSFGTGGLAGIFLVKQ